MVRRGSASEIVEAVIASGRSALLEWEVKAVLRELGVAVPHGRVASSAEAAVAAADDIGYPVAVKISSPEILHKTDAGGVVLGVQTPDEVRATYERVVARARRDRPVAEFRDVLVEEMCAQGQELIVGAFNDPQLGPVVMCGLGGIFVEVLRDVSFRVAPISGDDAREMWSELRAAPILRGVRGKGPLDTDALESLLLSVGGEGGLLDLMGGRFSELDLNPVFLYPRGLSVADARLLLATAEIPASPGRDEDLAAVMQAVFAPSSIAVIGASPVPGKLGHRIVRNLVDFGFRGRLYPVHPQAGEVYGVPAYPSLSDIPERVERVIVAVGAGATQEVVADCAENGVGVAQIYAAGFGELSERGAALERQLIASARGKVRLIGPNCFGTYSPASRITMIDGVSEEPGPVGFASQSGGLTLDAVRRGGEQGIRYRKAVSIGNSIDLGPADFLWDFGRDDEVGLVGMYIESVRDGRRFARLLREVGQRKPVVILKGGMTRTGARAAASHTGAVASDASVWQGLFRQAGVSWVESVEELFDTLLAFQMLPLRSGRGVALVGPGGGASVVASDAADRVGLEVVPFEDATVRALKGLGLPPGTSLVNPLDVPAGVLRLEEGRVLGNLLTSLVNDTHVDTLVVHLNAVSIFGQASGEVAASYVENMVSAVLRLRRDTTWPIALVLRSAGDEEQERVLRAERHRALAAGVPVFTSLDMALRAIAHVQRYALFRERHDAGLLDA